MKLPENLVWIPADLPPLDCKEKLISDFKDFYPTYGREAQRLTTKQDGYGSVDWVSGLTSSQLELKHYIDQYLPFEKLVNIKIQRLQTDDVQHYDYLKPEQNRELYLHNSLMEPCGYRFVLRGSRHGDLALYVDGKEIFPTLPVGTDCYILGHTNALHKVVHFRPDRYILFCHAWMDAQKHQNLIERSLAKYRSYAVWQS